MDLAILSICGISVFVQLISVWIALSIWEEVDKLFRSVRYLEREVIRQAALLAILKDMASPPYDQTDIDTLWRNTDIL